MRRSAVPLLCFALAAAPVCGCATPVVSLSEGPREYVATDYENVLRQWTRTERLFALSELDNFLTATATFESWDFRWAYVVRYVQDYRLTIEERKKLLEKALDETRTRHQFFVAIYGGELRAVKPNIRAMKPNIRAIKANIRSMKPNIRSTRRARATSSSSRSTAASTASPT